MKIELCSEQDASGRIFEFSIRFAAESEAESERLRVLVPAVERIVDEELRDAVRKTVDVVESPFGK